MDPPASVKAGTDYGTYSAAQPNAAAKNMMLASVDSQQTCCEHAMNMFRGRAVLPRNESKIVGFQDKHKGIPCRRMLVRPSRGGSLCHKHFFSNSPTSCSWLQRWLCRRTRSIVCTGLYTLHYSVAYTFDSLLRTRLQEKRTQPPTTSVLLASRTCSSVSLSNKLLLYNTVLKSVCSYSLQV